MFFFFSSRRRHTRYWRDWSSDVCSSDLSAHYFDYRDGIVAGGWYEQGTRLLDVRDPTDIRQIGYWIPTKGETWSVYFPPTDATGTIVYALDFARGIDRKSTRLNSSHANI